MKTLAKVFAGVLIALCSLTVALAAEKNLIYLHGCCIDKVGEHAYDPIIKTLKDDGFKVMFDLRKDDSTEAVHAYAKKVADHVKGLLAKGTAPEDITVAGFSLGSVTTMFASIEIANPKVNYVLLAGCPLTNKRSIDYAKVQGNILSLVDAKDDRFGSCKSHLSESALKKEITFESGEGHKIFRLSTDKAYKLWKEPLVAWAKGQH